MVTSWCAWRGGGCRGEKIVFPAVGACFIWNRGARSNTTLEGVLGARVYSRKLAGSCYRPLMRFSFACDLGPMLGLHNKLLWGLGFVWFWRFFRLETYFIPFEMLGFKWIYEQSKLLQQCAMAQNKEVICLKVNCPTKAEYSCEQQIQF